MEEEKVKATVAGKSVIIEMDANSKLGEKYISGDPHTITPNGNFLAGVVERQELLVVNGLEPCHGTITRTRKAKNIIEKSVIDIVIVSSDLVKDTESLEIDESRKHVLTRIRRPRKALSKKKVITTYR